MKRVLLHIGYHKTATSWLQNQLFVSTNTVFEPLSKNSHGQSTLGRKFLFNHEGYLISSFDLNTSELNKELETISATKPNLYNKIPVVSHENLSGNPCCGGPDAMSCARRLHNFFPDARVLIVIREQKSFLLSFYFQYLHMRGMKSINKFLKNRFDDLKIPSFSPDHLIYNGLIKHYFELFGSENVIVLPYELFRTNPQQFISELSVFLNENIKVDEKAFDRHINEKDHHFVNYYFRALKVFIKRGNRRDSSIINNFVFDFSARIILKLLYALVPKKLDKWTINRVKNRIAQWDRGRYKESNRQLSKLIARDLSHWGYY